MKCKPGDMAIVLRSVFEENIGAFVTVKSLYGPVPGDDRPYWNIEARHPLLCRDATKNDRVPTGRFTEIIVPDEDLHPIPKDKKADESTTKQHRPEKVTS